jgi:hypothetical protein
MYEMLLGDGFRHMECTVLSMKALESCHIPGFIVQFVCFCFDWRLARLFP